MTVAAIRPIVLALVRRSDGALLVTGHGLDSDDPRVRPVCGGIEFGETALGALDREFREELDVGVRDARLLSVFESIFGVDDGRLVPEALIGLDDSRRRVPQPRDEV